MKSTALALLLCMPGLATAIEQTSQRGPVQATLILEPDAPMIGDALTLEIRVRAEPGVELLMPAFGEALDRFEIVDFVPRESVDDSGATVSTQRYTLQPTRSGTLHVPPISIEFVDRRPGQKPAPDRLDAYELLTERIEIEVTSVLPEDAPLELRPAKPPLGARETPGPALWPFALLASAVLAALAPFVVRAWLAARERALQRSAYEIAVAALDDLLAETRPESDIDAFFVGLSGILRHYLENRFRLRSPELTTEEFLDVLVTSPDLGSGHQTLLGDLLARADLVKFARFVPDTPAIEKSVESLRQFLSETRAEPANG